MIVPNWDYFANAPLDCGTIKFRTKTERALHARVVASEINWKEYQTSNLLEDWIVAKRELKMYQNSLKIMKNLSLESELRLRVSSKNAHYAGGLVDGAYILNLFGDVATELTIRIDGDEGLLRAYDNIEFLLPVYAGDFLLIKGKIVKIGNTSRKILFEAYKIIESVKNSFINGKLPYVNLKNSFEVF
jgi:3-aminobutyryl-CoA ammonia-lyase